VGRTLWYFGEGIRDCAMGVKEVKVGRIKGRNGLDSWPHGENVVNGQT